MTVSYTAPSGIVYHGTVTLVSDDPDEPELAVAVELNGTGLGIGDQAPHYQLQEMSGTVIDTADLDGTVYLLSYFSTF